MIRNLILLTMFMCEVMLLNAQQVELNKANLCKRWNLEKYEVFWIDYEPEPNEQNDYLLFKSDFTFESVDEGEFGVGTWDYKVANDKCYLILKSADGQIRMIVEELKQEKLVVVLDDKELIDLEIHFSAAVNN